jgi:hypothetical protein
MANDITSSPERLWVLDTAGEIQADVGIPVLVRKIVYFPAAASNAVTIQEYGSGAVLRTALYIKAGPSDASAVTLDFGDNCRGLNGFKLSAISAGSIYVYIGRG